MPENLFKPKRAPTSPIVDQPVSQPVVPPVEPAPRVAEQPVVQVAPKPPVAKPVSKPVVAPAAKPAGRVELEELRFVPAGPVAPTGQDFELSQEDTKELLTRLRSVYEKSPATYDQQVAPTLIGFSKERGITPADLMAGAARAGSDLQEIRRAAGQEYGDPELRMTGEAAVNQALTVLGSRNLLPSVKTTKEAGQRATIRAKERSVVDMLPEEDRQRKAAKEQQLALQAPTFAPAAETYAFGSPVASDDPEVAKGEEAERARLIVEAIPPARRLRYTTGMDRLSSDSLAVMKESAEQIVGAEGVLMVINGEPINFRSTDARSILAEMKKQGVDLSKYGDEAGQLEAAGRVGSEVLRRAFARSLNELAALRTVNGITVPIRLRIPYQKLAGIARSGEFDPMKEQPLFRPEDLEMTPEQIMEREGLSGLPDALLLATAPMTEIVGFKAGGAPGESQQAVLLRQQSATETWFDRASMMYPWLKQTTMNGPVRMTDEGLTMIGPSEYLGEVLGGMQRRESAFEDIANNEKVLTYVKFTNQYPALAKAIGLSLPSMYQLDYNGDGKIDDADNEAGWKELKADTDRILASVLGLGAEAVSPDLFDVAGPILSAGARGGLRAIRYNPAAVKVLRDEAAALAGGDLETAASKARELGYRQGVSQEKSALDAEAVSSGNAPDLANAAIVVDSVVAQEMRLAGQADEMFDTKLIESLPVVKVEGAGETVLDIERRQGYQHGSLRVKDDEDAMVKEGRRSRYGYQQALKDLDAMEAAVKRGEGHFPEQVKAATKELLDEAGAVNAAAKKTVETARDLIENNRMGEAIRVAEAGLKAADIPDTDAIKIMAKIKEAADKAVATNAKALAEAPAAIERARKGVAQQAASRQRAVQELADFAEGVNGRGRVGRWMNKNLPAIDRQLARFRKPGDFKAFVTRRSLLDAAASMTVEQRKAKVKAALDGVESARKRRAAAEVAALKATASNDQAAIDKANKAIDAARERLVKAHEAVAAAITDGTVNGLSAGGHRLLARLVDAFDDRFNDVELAATAVQYEGRAKKMVEDGLAGSTDEWLDSIDFTTATAVPTGSVDEVLLAGRPISPAFYSGLRAAVEKFGDKPLTVESVIAQLKKQPAVKADELHWTRLSDFLAGKKTVSKQEMLDWLDEHAVVINVEGAVASGYDEVAEVERVFTARMEEARRRGASDDEIDEIDAAWDKANADAYRRYLARIRDRSYRSQYHEYTLPGESTNYAEITFTSPMAKGWDAPHFGQSERDKDLLFHMRVNERELPDGRRVLFVEEIQSDWHQSGRSQGYRGQGLPAEVEQRIQAKTQARMAEADRKYAQQSAALSTWGEARAARIRWEAANPMPTPPAEMTPENRVAWRRAVAEWRDNDVFSEERAAWDRLKEAANDEVGAEPTLELRGPVGQEKIYLSPYVSKGHTQVDLQDNFAARRDNEHRLAKVVAETAREKALAAQPPMAPFADNWHEYAFKYALRLAAERGLDGVAWTTGIQQTARYSDQLRQVVDKIEWKALPDGSRQVIGHKGARKTYQTTVGPDGFILNPGEVDDGKRLSEVLSSSMAKQIMGSDEGLLEGDNLTIGGQGMQAFYDERLPGFARKYARGQGWGVDVEKISLDKPASFVTVDDVTDWEEAEALVDRARALAVRSVPADRLAWVDFYEDIQRETPVSRAWAQLPKRLQTAENADKIGLPARMVTGKPSADRVVHLLPLNEKAKDDILYRGQTLFQPTTAAPTGSADEVLESATRRPIPPGNREIPTSQPTRAPLMPAAESSVSPRVRRRATGEVMRADGDLRYRHAISDDIPTMVKEVQDLPWFHGARQGDIQLADYDVRIHSGTRDGNMFGPGLYLAENPEVAISYAASAGQKLGTGTPGKSALKAVSVKPERVLDIRQVVAEKKRLLLGEYVQQQLLDGGVDARIADYFAYADDPAEVGEVLNSLREAGSQYTQEMQDILDSAGLRLKDVVFGSGPATREAFANALASSRLNLAEDPGFYIGASDEIKAYEKILSLFDEQTAATNDFETLAASFDGLLHTGRKDGNVLVLFDPNDRLKTPLAKADDPTVGYAAALREGLPEFDDKVIAQMAAAAYIVNDRSGNFPPESVLRQFFQPGMEVPGYGGIDTVIEYHGDGKVSVKGPRDVRARTHSTTPDRLDVRNFFRGKYTVDLEGIEPVRQSVPRGDRAILKSESRALPEQILYQDDAPDLSAAPRTMTLFSGGGLVEVGLRGLINPVSAVEANADIAGVYRKAHGDHVQVADVRGVDYKKQGQIDYLHASPVCTRASKANVTAGGECDIDIETAQATAKAIVDLKPRVFTLENVADYEDFAAMKIITDALVSEGYTFDAQVYNAADYGAATNRKRLLLRAVKDGPLPPKPAPVAQGDWHERIADMIEDLPDDAGLAPWQRQRLAARGVNFERPERPMIVMGGSAGKSTVPFALAGQPAPTIKATSGEVHRLVLPDGRVKRLNERALARITGLPDDYPLPESDRLARTIIGNGVPPDLTRAVFGPLLRRQDDPSILLDQAKAFVQFSADGRATVALMQKGDFSSLIHETAHIFRRTLSEKDNATVVKWARTLNLDVSLENGRFVGPDAIKAEEAFARGYERFVREGKSPVKALSMVFEKIKEWMHRTYLAVKGSPIDVKLNPDIEAVFANMTTPKAWMDEAKPTIMGEKIAPAMTAQDWLATRLSRAGVNMTGADIERRLAAGETIELPFKVFGRNEVSEEDLARIQSSLDRVSALQETRADFTVPFDNVQQSVVEPTLVGELQSTMSAGKTLRDDQAATRKVGRVIGRAASAVLAGADALKNERIFSPRLRELAKEGERILNQRIGDFNVLMRDASRSLSYQHLFDYMTGAEVKFSIGGRRPLSAGHDAVDEASQILQAQHGKLTSDTSIRADRAYLGNAADMPATGWLGKDGTVVTDEALAAPPSQVIGDVATLAFDAGAVADRDARSARLAAFFDGPSGPARLRQVRLSAIHMMESSPFLRHLAAAVFDTSDLDEARTAAEIIGTVAPDRILAYLEAVYKLAGGKIDMVEVGRRGLVFDPDMTSQEKVEAFFDVLTREKFGPVAVNRALSVVNVFGSQKTVYNRVADIGMTFSGDQRKAFRNFLNGGFTTPQEYEAGLRMFGEFGFNYNALDEAAKIAGSVKSTRYMPNNVQRQIGRALGRALDESTEVEKKVKGSGGKVPQFIKSGFQAVQSLYVRGRYIAKSAKVWMDLLDTGVMSGAVGGFSLGTESVVRQVLQSAFVSVQGHVATKAASLGTVKTNQVREALQWVSDQLVDRVTGRTLVASVNDTLIGANKVIRLPDGRRYTYSDLLQTAIANGVVASFETSELSENVRKAIEVGLSRRVFPAAVADAADWTSEQREVWIKANSELFETWAERERIGVMLGLLHRGATPEQAARLTVKALFDYPGSLADTETKGSWSGLFLSLAQPYWTWQKNINHFLINALEEPAVQYRLGVVRRASDKGPEAVSQALYTVMVDPYGFDLDKMNPEERRLYFYLRAAYEESLGKESWQMSEEERLTFAAALWATHFQASETMVDGKLFHLSAEDAREVERRLKGSTAAMTLSENYVPRPNVGNVPDYQRGRIRAVLPFKNTDAMLDYIRNTDQQDLMMSLVFYEPGPIGGYNYLINSSKLMWGLASMPAAMMTEQPVVNETMTTRYLDGLVDPERMPLVSETIVFLQGGSKTRLAEPVANMFRASDVTDRLLVYRKMDPVLQESYDRDVANGVDPNEAGRRYGQVIYANPLMSALFNTVPFLYDFNRAARQLETRGAFSRDSELADIRRVLLLSGLLSDVGEVSQRKTEERTVYEIPKKATPR